MGCPTVRGRIVRYPYVSPPYYGALFVGDGVSLPIPPQFGCDECILTHITLYLNQKGGKSRAKLVGSSWYLTPLLWDTLKRQHHGAAVAGTVDSSPDVAFPTPATSLPVATLAQVPSSGTSFFPSPLFNIGRPGSHQQMEMQWRLQVQESITTLQRGQVYLEQSVTSLQVESSVSRDAQQAPNAGKLHCAAPVLFEAWRSPAEKTHSLLTLRGSSKDGRYVHFPMFYGSSWCEEVISGGVFRSEELRCSWAAWWLSACAPASGVNSTDELAVVELDRRDLGCLQGAAADVEGCGGGGWCGEYILVGPSAVLAEGKRVPGRDTF